ncbi:MAG: RDD family protein [Gemmatimonadetes bacterium]|nr:RDD family protein [Gemmatimonadota bacterium]
MKTCAVCDEQVTPRELRQGSAIARGVEVYHRDCHRATQGSVNSGSRPAAAATSFAGSSDYASFGRRLGAHLLDGIILNLVVIACALPFGVLSAMSGGDPGAGSLIGGAIGFVLPLVYFLWFWSKSGATPGKKLLGIQIVGPDGGPPTAVQSLIRYLGYIPSSLFFCLGFLWMIWDGEKRTWHDMMAGTRVVRA